MKAEILSLAIEATCLLSLIDFAVLFVNESTYWRSVDLSPQTCLAFWRGVFWSLTRAGFARVTGVLKNACKKS